MMYIYLVGINGSHTPDPAYWRARNEFIKAKSAKDAKDKWIEMRQGWLREDEKLYIKTIQVPYFIKKYPAYQWELTDYGIEHINHFYSFAIDHYEHIKGV